jgi:hypothetical protein
VLYEKTHKTCSKNVEELDDNDINVYELDKKKVQKVVHIFKSSPSKNEAAMEVMMKTINEKKY